MTREWIQNIPDVFNPDIEKELTPPEKVVPKEASKPMSLDEYRAASSETQNNEPLTREDVRKIVREELLHHEARMHKKSEMNQRPFENEPIVRIILGCGVAWFLLMMIG